MLVVAVSLVPGAYFTPFRSLGPPRHNSNRRSSVQLTLGFAQGPASCDVQDAIDGHGPAAQALHGGQQTFHLQLQWVISLQNDPTLWDCKNLI